jgi:hypothetical protein
VPGVLEFWRGLHTEGHAEEVRMELHGDDLQLTFSEAEVRTRHVRLR